jgi:fructan beta-fructosidase
MIWKRSFIFCVMLTFFTSMEAQEVIKKIPDDPYGLSYADVFDNMHYNQTYRPQVHYTPITGQIADATGLIFYKGEYHLFYMYDEWSNSRKYNKSWGHATSYDCIFWEQKPQILNTLLDNRPGSGSGIIDWNNSLGLRSGVEKTMVVFYTDYGRGTCIAFSRDAGKTWIRHKNNPVIPMPEGRADRDAFVFWYKPDQSWRLILYQTPAFSFYKSVDLLHWTYLSKIDGFHECPDFLEMPVDNDMDNKRWVIINGDGTYRIGDFDGNKFSSKMENTKVDFGNCLYATQTFKRTYEGDGPFIQLAFLRLQGTPDQNRTWSQQMSFPCELTLKTINGDIRLCRNPSDAVKQLREESHFWKNALVSPADNPLAEIRGDVFEIIAEIDPAKSAGFLFDIRGEKLIYSSKEQQLTFMGNQARVSSADQKIKLKMIIDRGSVEVFVNEGELSFSNLFYPDPANMNFKLFSTGGICKLVNMEVYRLSSIWLKREQELGYYRTNNNKY